jgi:hypothetical protein
MALCPARTEIPEAPMTTITELLAARSCSPQCLVARDPRSACGCRCTGEYHGALATATVRDASDGSALERSDALSTTTDSAA